MVESGNKENNRSLNISVSTNVGKFRKNNEDNFYVDGYMTNNEAFNDFTSEYKMDLSENRIFFNSFQKLYTIHTRHADVQ